MRAALLPPSPPPPAPPVNTRTPLSHHAILALVAPFQQRGWQVDLAHSHRAEAKLRFQPAPGPAGAGPAPAGDLWLEVLDAGRFRLTRQVQAAGSAPGNTPASSALTARLVAEGQDTAALLDGLAAVPPERQIHTGPGWVLALSHRLASVPAGPLVLTDAVASLPAGLRLSARVPAGPGLPADLQLEEHPAGPTPPALPDDLVAVLGRPWGLLNRRDEGWRFNLQLRGRGPQRSSQAEARLLATTRHLVATLAASPAAFHPAWPWARRAVMLRRWVPLAVAVGLIAGAALLPRLGIARDSNFMLMVLNAPPLLLIAFFCLREVPRIEVPPWPRPLPADAWRPEPPNAP